MIDFAIIFRFGFRKKVHIFVSMKAIIKISELGSMAAKYGMFIHRECGGYRLCKPETQTSRKNIYPADGICPVTTKRNIFIFLKGVELGASLKARR